jgi:hypothetical protein
MADSGFANSLSTFAFTVESILMSVMSGSDTSQWGAFPDIRMFGNRCRPCVLHSLRRDIMQGNGWSLRDLYRTLETPGANRLRDA